MVLTYGMNKRGFEPRRDLKIGIEELLIGLSFGIGVSIMGLGWGSVLVIPLVSILWALGGATSKPKALRRVGVPLLVCIFGAWNLWSWKPLLSFLPLFGVLTMGYGIPTFHGRGGSMDDEGSTLGKFFFWRVANRSEKVATFYTRITIAILEGLALLPFAFFSVSNYLKGVLTIVVGMLLFGVIIENEGEVAL